MRADTFGSGANEIEIEFVPIGSPGNPPYSVANPAGAVDYRYRMAKYEISEQMIDKANATGGLGITKDTRGPNKPATSITWYEAAQFVNWLNTSTGYPRAYKFVGSSFQLWDPNDPGYNPNNLYRNKLAKYVLPSLNEWYKSAYYDPNGGAWYDYPTGSNEIPDGMDSVGDPNFEVVFNDGASNPGPNDISDAGLPSPYYTTAQGGNVREWIETAFDRISDEADEHRRIQGGSWGDIHTLMNASNGLTGWTPLFQGDFVGFRVAAVPEPSSQVPLIVAAAAIWFGGRNAVRGVSGLLERNVRQ